MSDYLRKIEDDIVGAGVKISLAEGRIADAEVKLKEYEENNLTEEVIRIKAYIEQKRQFIAEQTEIQGDLRAIRKRHRGNSESF